MITIQATKQSVSSNKPSREDYADSKDGKRWQYVPLIFLLFVTACATYLKSFLPVTLRAQEARPAERAPEGEETLPGPDETISVDEAADILPEKLIDKQPPVRTAHAFNVMADAAGTATGISLVVRTPVAAPATDFSQPTNVSRPTLPPDTDVDASPQGSNGNSDQDRPNAARLRDDSHTDQPASPPFHPAANRAPRVGPPVRLADMVGCQSLVITLLALLAGTTDPEADELRIVGLSSSSGVLTRTPDGNWEFTRDHGMLGEVKLTYTISDGTHLATQTAYFSVIEAPPIIGTPMDDNIVGTHCGDTIDGLAGDDNIDGRAGNDKIAGGDGNDHIVAGPGNDIVYAGDGNDIVFAGSGNDVVFGGSGNDRLFGEDGNDTLFGESGDDQLVGGSGADTILGAAGNDVLHGDDGNDVLDGGTGDDLVYGGSGDDVVAGGDGHDHVAGHDGNDLLADGFGMDVVYGGAGNDHVVASADAHDDRFLGGDGNNSLDYSAAVQGMIIDLGIGRADGTDVGHDTFTEFQTIIAGQGDDQITAGAASASIFAGAGNDTVADGAGSDKVAGGDGDDRVVAAVDGVADVYDGEGGRDTLDYSGAVLTITVDLRTGSAEGRDIGRDLIAGFEEIIGGAGDDRFVAGQGSISMTGGDGNDTFEFERGGSEHQPDVVRKITDFTVGDRIVAATYEITFRDDDGSAQEQIADMFGDIYLNSGNLGLPVRFRFEEVGGGAYTIAEIADRPDPEDVMLIEIAGHHHLQFTTVGS